jgi:hypothetical protein
VISWACKYRGGTERSGDICAPSEVFTIFPHTVTSYRSRGLLLSLSNMKLESTSIMISELLLRSCAAAPYFNGQTRLNFFSEPLNSATSKNSESLNPTKSIRYLTPLPHLRCLHLLHHHTCKHSTSNPLPLHLHFIHLTNLPLLITSIHPSYPSRQALSSSPHRHTSPHPTSAP